MTAKASEILAQCRELPLTDRRELVQVLLKDAAGGAAAPPRRPTVAEVAGKFRPTPNPHAKDHDRWFAEAILASKRGDDTP